MAAAAETCGTGASLYQALKILHVMAGAATGGAEAAFIDTCLALQAAGMEIEVAARANPRNERLRTAGIVVHELPFGGVFDFTTTRHLKKIIATFQPAIVQSWMSRATQKLPRRSAKASYKVIARLGGYYKLKHFHRADHFIANTPAIAQYIIGEGVASTRVSHINNFADLENAVQPADRAALQTPADAKLLLALGRLHRVKAFDVLLTALADVPGAYLWIAGEGPERSVLEQQAAVLGVADRVRFLGWRDDRAALFAAADVCVFPSRFEPFGNVFVQAWAQRLPLVVTASDGPRQYVRDEEDCLLVPVDDAPALAGAIRRVLADPTLGQRLVTNGRARYENEFTREKTVAAYRALYAQLASGGATASAG